MTDTEKVQYLIEGIQKILDGDYPNPRQSRPKQCQHGIEYWQSCEQCTESALIALLKQVRQEAS